MISSSPTATTKVTIKSKSKKTTKEKVKLKMIKYTDFWIPEEWQEVLDFFGEKGDRYLCGGHQPYIAGGSLRDLELGADVKDVDIWIQINGPDKGSHSELKYCLEGKDGVEITKETTISKETTEDEREYFGELNVFSRKITDVTKFKYKGINFDLIRLDDDEIDLENILQGFDLGICQIGYDGSYVYVTENYIRDKSCKTITILNGLMHKHGGLRHLERVAAKYPEYRVI
jgi:hypothetical protein